MHRDSIEEILALGDIGYAIHEIADMMHMSLDDVLEVLIENERY